MSQPDAEHAPTDGDIGSKEGLSIDHLARLRLDFEIAQNGAIVQQTFLADAKAATLMALIGALAMPGADIARDAHGASLATTGLAGLVIVLCLMVLLPRIAGADVRAALHRRDRFSWPALTGAQYGEDAHADFMRTSQASDLIMATARSNVAAAMILQRKYQLLRVAMILAVGYLVSLVAIRFVTAPA